MASRGHLPDELRYFRQTTQGATVLMGRRTFESNQSKPLPTRRNFVLSNSLQQAAGVTVVRTVQEALEEMSASNPEGSLFVIGGTRVYAAALPVADRLYGTVVHARVTGDVYFPGYQQSEWLLRRKTFRAADPRHAYSYTMYVWG